MALFYTLKTPCFKGKMSKFEAKVTTLKTLSTPIEEIKVFLIREEKGLSSLISEDFLELALREGPKISEDKNPHYLISVERVFCDYNFCDDKT